MYAVGRVWTRADNLLRFQISRETRCFVAFLILQYTAASLITVVVFHEPWRETGLLPPVWFLTGRQGADSWASMDKAHVYLESPRSDTLYADTFFSRELEHKGFQYPQTALLISEVAARLAERRRAEVLFTWLWIPATALFLALIDRRLVRTAGCADRAARDVACCFATLTFFPVMRAYADGQMQTWINGLLAAALLACIAGRSGASGAAVAAACLLKPQAGLLALWAALRGRWRFTAAFVVVTVLGLAVSIVRYGAASHLEYLDVLRFLSQHGESFFPNQSVNGLLHRWLGNGHNLTFYAPGSIRWIDHFPPYHPVVYAGTLITSALLLLVALLPPRQRGERGGALDFAIAIIAVTVASPIAWEHHFGVLLPIFLVMYHAARKRRLGGRFTAALAVCYVVAANPWWVTRQLAATPWNVLQSYLLFAALGLMGLALMARRKPECD